MKKQLPTVNKLWGTVVADLKKTTAIRNKAKSVVKNVQKAYQKKQLPKAVLNAATAQYRATNAVYSEKKKIYNKMSRNVVDARRVAAGKAPKYLAKTKSAPKKKKSTPKKKDKKDKKKKKSPPKTVHLTAFQAGALTLGNNQRVSISNVFVNNRNYRKCLCRQNGSTPGMRLNSILLQPNTLYAFKLIGFTSSDNTIACPWVNDGKKNVLWSCNKNTGLRGKIDRSLTIKFKTTGSTRYNIGVLFKQGKVNDAMFVRELNIVQVESGNMMKVVKKANQKVSIASSKLEKKFAWKVTSLQKGSSPGIHARNVRLLPSTRYEIRIRGHKKRGMKASVCPWVDNMRGKDLVWACNSKRSLRDRDSVVTVPFTSHSDKRTTYRIGALFSNPSPQDDFYLREILVRPTEVMYGAISGSVSALRNQGRVSVNRNYRWYGSNWVRVQSRQPKSTPGVMQTVTLKPNTNYIIELIGLRFGGNFNVCPYVSLGGKNIVWGCKSGRSLSTYERRIRVKFRTPKNGKSYQVGALFSGSHQNRIFLLKSLKIIEISNSNKIAQERRSIAAAQKKAKLLQVTKKQDSSTTSATKSAANLKKVTDKVQGNVRRLIASYVRGKRQDLLVRKKGEAVKAIRKSAQSKNAAVKGRNLANNLSAKAKQLEKVDKKNGKNYQKRSASKKKTNTNLIRDANRNIGESKKDLKNWDKSISKLDSVEKLWTPRSDTQIKANAVGFRGDLSADLFKRVRRGVFHMKGLSRHAWVQIVNAKPLKMSRATITATGGKSQWVAQYHNGKTWKTTSSVWVTKSGTFTMKWKAGPSSKLWRLLCTQNKSPKSLVWFTRFQWFHIGRFNDYNKHPKIWKPNSAAQVTARSKSFVVSRALNLFNGRRYQNVVTWDRFGNGGWLQVTNPVPIKMQTASIFVAASQRNFKGTANKWAIQYFDGKGWKTVVKTPNLRPGWNRFSWSPRAASTQWRWLCVSNPKHVRPWIRKMEWQYVGGNKATKLYRPSSNSYVVAKAKRFNRGRATRLFQPYGISGGNLLISKGNWVEVRSPKPVRMVSTSMYSTASKDAVWQVDYYNEKARRWTRVTRGTWTDKGWNTIIWKQGPSSRRWRIVKVAHKRDAWYYGLEWRYV